MPMQAPVFGRKTPRRKPWERPEGVPDRRVRGSAGVKMRAQVKREEPLCRLCTAKGLVAATTEVDHIVPLSRGGGNQRSNMQGLCTPCHDEKSKAERAAVRD